jgi:hypothetical protein
MSISTVPCSRRLGPALLHHSQHFEGHPAVVLAASSELDLSSAGIRHGRALLMLGHAAEYLANSRRFLSEDQAKDSEGEAIHLLHSLSRKVFEEYAEVVLGKRQTARRLTHGGVSRLLC